MSAARPESPPFPPSLAALAAGRLRCRPAGGAGGGGGPPQDNGKIDAVFQDNRERVGTCQNPKVLPPLLMTMHKATVVAQRACMCSPSPEDEADSSPSGLRGRRRLGPALPAPSSATARAASRQGQRGWGLPQACCVLHIGGALTWCQVSAQPPLSTPVMVCTLGKATPVCSVHAYCLACWQRAWCLTA